MNPFTTLGLAEDATPAEVKKAYRARLLQVHPDVVGDGGRQITIDVIAAYKQAMLVAQANAASAIEAARVVDFVPAWSPANEAGNRNDSAFVASIFRAVA